MTEEWSKKIDRMSLKQIERLYDSCCEILSFVGFDERENNIVYFSGVDDVLYLLQEKLGILDYSQYFGEDDEELPNKSANETLITDEMED